MDDFDTPRRLRSSGPLSPADEEDKDDEEKGEEEEEGDDGEEGEEEEDEDEDEDEGAVDSQFSGRDDAADGSRGRAPRAKGRKRSMEKTLKTIGEEDKARMRVVVREVAMEAGGHVQSKRYAFVWTLQTPETQQVRTPPPSLPVPTHWLTHSLTHSLTHLLTHSLTLPLSRSCARFRRSSATCAWTSCRLSR